MSDNQKQSFFVPLGPLEKKLVIDNFSYRSVRESHCVARISKNICRHLVHQAQEEDVKYLTICIPAYNEEYGEMMKTLITLMQNIEFMFKKAAGDSYFQARPSVLKEFKRIVPVVVPIFDGTKAISKSMRKWIEESFPHILDDLTPNGTIPDKHDVDVRVACAKWWYLSEINEEEYLKEKNQKFTLESLFPKLEGKQQHGEFYQFPLLEQISDSIHGVFQQETKCSPKENEVQKKDIQVKKENEGSAPTNDSDIESQSKVVEQSTTSEDGRDSSRDGREVKSIKSASSGFGIPYEVNDEPLVNDDFMSQLQFVDLERATNDVVSPGTPIRRDSDTESFYEIRDPQNNLVDPNSKQIIPFYLCPIVKKSNHRKHNSHQWFFDSICDGLEDKVTYALLTDCGTSFNEFCVAKLLAELHTMPDLIGVTARQRVELPCQYFHPCLEAPFSFLQGKHEFGSPACWKCWTNYFMSPCPLQGVEFEASVTISLAMFNLVEALPVMPGPCQLMHYQKMKEFNVVDEYFNLLFEGENEKKALPPLPEKLKPMRLPSDLEKMTSKLEAKKEQQQEEVAIVPEVLNCPTKSMSVESMSDIGTPIASPREGKRLQSSGSYYNVNFPNFPDSFSRSTSNLQLKHDSPMNKSNSLGNLRRSLSSFGSMSSLSIFSNSNSPMTKRGPRGITPPDESKSTITFAEFLRFNMRLAEDRILTFVSIFSTGYGTKWVLGSTFYYQPEVQWNTLLTQRRRWTNGTFAGFLFSFVSQRAKTRIDGGMFDAHKPGKSIRVVYGLWSLQVIILCFLFVTPAIFGAAVYKCLVLLGNQWPEAFSWALIPLFNEVRIVELLSAIYLGIYSAWSIGSFYADRGKIPEYICQLMAIYCALTVCPIYISIWRTIILDGISFVGGLVIVNLVIPIVLSLGEDLRAAGLYLLYLPWLLALILMMIVFFPAYSFARLWDTTWGNRATGKDSALNEKMEDYLKTKNFEFNLFLIGMNIFLLWAFVKIIDLGPLAIIVFMFISFLPIIIQLFLSSAFLFIVRPLRKYFLNFDTPNEDGHQKNNKNNNHQSPANDQKNNLQYSHLKNQNQRNNNNDHSPYDYFSILEEHQRHRQQEEEFEEDQKNYYPPHQILFDDGNEEEETKDAEESAFEKLNTTLSSSALTLSTSPSQEELSHPILQQLATNSLRAEENCSAAAVVVAVVHGEEDDYLPNLTEIAE